MIINVGLKEESKGHKGKSVIKRQEENKTMKMKMKAKDNIIKTGLKNKEAIKKGRITT